MIRKFRLPLIRVISLLLLAASVLVLNQPALAQAQLVAVSSSVSSTEKSGPSLEASTSASSSEQAAVPVASKYPLGVEAARAALAARLRISIDSVRVVSYQSVTWRDSCLGIYYPNQGCLMVITPGYRVVLEANGQIYVAHTDLTGKIIRWAPATN
jgi:hypothetical protein